MELPVAVDLPTQDVRAITVRLLNMNWRFYEY